MSSKSIGMRFNEKEILFPIISVFHLGKNAIITVHAVLFNRCRVTMNAIVMNKGTFMQTILAFIMAMIHSQMI